MVEHQLYAHTSTCISPPPPPTHTHTHTHTHARHTHIHSVRAPPLADPGGCEHPCPSLYNHLVTTPATGGGQAAQHSEGEPRPLMVLHDSVFGILFTGVLKWSPDFSLYKRSVYNYVQYVLACGLISVHVHVRPCFCTIV